MNSDDVFQRLKAGTLSTAARRPVPPALPVAARMGPPPLPPVVTTKVAVEKVGRVKQSKKLDLSKLPKQWRSTVFAYLKPEKQARLTSAVAMLWATGCRPVEIEKGVNVRLEGGQLIVEIRGAKHGVVDNGEVAADRGLEWRKLKINPSLNPATEYLARLCADGRLHVVEYNKNSLRTRLNEVGRLSIRKMPKDVTLSPYTFRHAMGSDVKSCDDLTDEERSMIMGHLAVDSLSVYGRRRHRGGVKPVASVEASAEPRGEYTDAPPVKTKPKFKI